MPALLTESDYQEAAESLGVDLAAVKAVAQVESSGSGFLSDGRVKVLFEGHQFWRFTNGAYAESHPTICYRQWTRKHYVTGSMDERGAGELARLELAASLDRVAALKSASYGKFQIMGFHFLVCGFPTVERFWEAMQESEREHLLAFVAFLKHARLVEPLRAHKWAAFARGYNGVGYRANKYDVKLAAAHKRYSEAT